MLFSNPDVADYINESFEPVWESVRPVPRVTIDFGNGKVVRRTLSGNVATYACTADGKVLDILPGIYEPGVYLHRLKELRLLFEYVDTQFTQLSLLQEYHDRQAERLANGSSRDNFVHVVRRTITGAEAGTRLMLLPSERIQARRRARNNVEDKRLAGASVTGRPNKSRPSKWESLATDTHLNETKRRTQIHRHLSKQPSRTPDQLKHWLYREVLHADLEDPFLGLGKLLFDKYPFEDDLSGTAMDARQRNR